MTEQDLLKVLDMSEEKQDKWTYISGIRKHHPTDENRIESLVDLAFRLRDEVFKEYGVLGGFHDGIYKVQEYLGEDAWATAFWGECIAKPIHWIIAALIAKEKEDDKPN